MCVLKVKGKIGHIYVVKRRIGHIYVKGGSSAGKGKVKSES